jgi:hypothetical protein
MEQPRRKTAVSMIVISLVAGIIGLSTVTGRPRFSVYATVDVLQSWPPECASALPSWGSCGLSGKWTALEHR